MLRSTTIPTRTLLLLWQTPLDHSNGVAVQFRRMFADFNEPIFHVRALGNVQSSPNFTQYFGARIWMNLPSINLRFGGATLQRLWRSPGIRVASRIAGWRAFSRGLSRPEIAYVSVCNESEAHYAREVLRALNIKRYVLHLMDLLHHSGAHELDGGSMERLVKDAFLVRTVSPRLAKAVAPWRAGPIEVSPLLSGFSSPARNPPQNPPRVFMSASLNHGDPSALDFLQKKFARAWERFAAFSENASWVYAGANYEFLDAATQRKVKNLGLLSDQRYIEEISRATCAILPMEHSTRLGWQYSLPSRMVDYLAAGLPVIAPPSEGTATGDFLAEHNGNGVIVVRSEEECYATLHRLHNDAMWYRHHQQAALQIGRRYDAAEGRSSFHTLLNALQESLADRPLAVK